MKAVSSYSTRRAYCFYNSEDIYSVFHITTLNNHFPESRVHAKIHKKLLSNAHPSIMKTFRTNVLLMNIIHEIRCLGTKPPTSSTLSTDFKMNELMSPSTQDLSEAVSLCLRHPFQPGPHAHSSCPRCQAVFAKPSLTTYLYHPGQRQSFQPPFYLSILYIVL